MIIYKTTNLINGKIYIGQDANDNPKYLGSGTRLRYAFKKYGKTNFKKETLSLCYSKKELDEQEIYWIKFFDSTNKAIGYNICHGGQGGMIRTDEEKELMGTYDKISNAHKCVSLSDEHKAAIANGLSKYKKPDPYKDLTEDEKRKIKVGNYNNFAGKTHKDELNYKEKYTTQTGVTPTNAYKVIDVETGEIFDSCNAAAQKFKNPNTARRAIAAVCKGLRKHFKYKIYEFIK
jgi:group I intron endonuclease